MAQMNRLVRPAPETASARPAKLPLKLEAAARAAQQQRHEALWAERMRGIDELVAMASPKPAVQPLVQLVHSDEPYEGSARLGDSDFNPQLLTDPSRW
jgi:hypothetical protein